MPKGKVRGEDVTGKDKKYENSNKNFSALDSLANEWYIENVIFGERGERMRL